MGLDEVGAVIETGGGGGGGGAVTSVAGRTGVVVLGESDITGLTTDLAAKAPSASPTFTGTVTLPSGLVLPSGVSAPSGLAMGASKITGLANGSASTDAAAFGQLPTKLSDLAGANAGDVSLNSHALTNVLDLAVTGSGGSTATNRFMGAVSGAAPTSGTYNTGDWVVDVLTGADWVCTAGGTPGTWVQSFGTEDPQMNGYLGQSMSLEAATDANTAALSSGRIYFARIQVRQSAPSGTRTLGVYCKAAGATLTSGQCLIATYGPTGTQLGSTSADQSTNWATAGYYEVTLGTFALTAGSVIYGLLLANGTTPPQFGGNANAACAALNANLAAANLRFGQQTVSGATTMPASITPSSLVATNAQAIGMWIR